MSRSWRPGLRVIGLVCAVLSAGRADAAPGSDQQPVTPGASQPQADPDFWFGQPRGSVGVRGSWFLAREGSDLFVFLRDNLTINSGDFHTAVIGGEVGFTMTPRLDALVGVDFSKASKNSEYRHFVDNNRLPITQETALKQVNLTGSVKIALLPRGRSVSRFAWIPRTVTPYAGAGAGALWYQLAQKGDFVDFVDRSVFRSTFQSSGWSPTAHLFVGSDILLWRRLFLALEGRYSWAHAELGGSFSGFAPIDLAGFRLTSGVNVAF